MSIEHILCAVDGSAPSLRAVTQATQVARGLQSQLTIVWVRTTGHGTATGSPPRSHPILRAVLSVAAETALQNGFEGVLTVQVSAPDVAAAVADYAGRHKVGLIFAGATGLDAPSPFTFGSTCMDLIRYAPCPVTIVH